MPADRLRLSDTVQELRPILLILDPLIRYRVPPRFPGPAAPKSKAQAQM